MPEFSDRHDVEIVLLLAAPTHRYEGRPADGPAPATPVEVRTRIELKAGLGVVGDRHFNRPAHRRASATVMAVEKVEALVPALGLDAVPDFAATRRNIMLRGADVDALKGRRFVLDSGDGPVEFQGHRPANPCAWMDVMLAPGAFKALRGGGGIRCEPLTNGVLTKGPATLTILD
ncbi:molybdenum cofactor biosysynthesis protein [Herbiconiux sp. L3-i23]|uniref:molybdenum cofactor biosysynthesis protein n=1 Tax=Herbiconiux sp. L3-i23 TaxID=2905871 RepID=UPI00206F505D|nr:molybdenum cofactor biosysynthesis protein [Herbiconiux sp. L3-i23]BDI23638.1 hypothetical protein L3i23_24140 [Herbiconiux sp. L3-i23]